ncbi:MAG: flavoprotein [Phycisphaerales bacterium]|jgi:phosphopantothenoylcysteine decarboxylase/phosphopantothenate--cysteine ligase|nr:flavoprotein [Phycisphaerales bacterium]
MNDRRTQSEGHLAGRHLLVALTGGIACYKIAALVSTLVQIDVTVDVLMTDAATRFISPLTFESLTSRQVFDSQWKHGKNCSPRHIQLAKQADGVLVAPCTMNMLAKLATGRTDDPVSLVVSAVNRETTPVLLAPSMNVTMLEQPVTKRNILTLQQDGFTILESDDGWQACKSNGKGRLPEPESLLASFAACFG